MTGSDMNIEIPLKSSRVLQLCESEAESLLCLCNLRSGLDSWIHGGTKHHSGSNHSSTTWAAGTWVDETLETIPQTDSKKQQRKTLDGRQVIIILLLESSQSKMEDVNQGHTEPPSHGGRSVQSRRCHVPPTQPRWPTMG